MARAIVFDAYGTLFDVHSVARKADELFPGKGTALSQLWRNGAPAQNRPGNELWEKENVERGVPRISRCGRFSPINVHDVG